MYVIGTPANKKHLVRNSAAVIEVLRQQQQLLGKLRALVVPLLCADDPSGELIVHLLEDVVRCNFSVLSQLQRGNPYDVLPAVVKSPIHDRNEEQDQKSFSRKRRRNQNISRSLVTDTPHYDGHQWRKYGQKYISGMKHPRCYYRCTHSKEQNCEAAKTIQKIGKSDFSSSYDTIEYTVVYYGHHICMGSCNNAGLTSSNTMISDHQNIFLNQEIIEDAMDPELSILLKEFSNIPVNPHFWGTDQIISLEQLQAGHPFCPEM